MTGTQQKTTGRKDSDANRAAYYVYCVIETSAAGALVGDELPPPIEEDTVIESIPVENLAAITSRVPLSSFGEVELAERLTDPAWTAVRAMRHEQVVEHFAKNAGTVPLRFGTVYLAKANVEQMLSEKRQELSKIIERLRDREEWGINVYCDRSRLMESITSLSPKLKALANQAATTSPGQSYLMKKKIEALRADEARVEINRVVDEIEAALKTHTNEAKRLRVLRAEATEHGDLKAKFAVLIPKSTFKSFREKAEELAQANEAAGIRLELTGPWPAYNFTN